MWTTSFCSPLCTDKPCFGLKSISFVHARDVYDLTRPGLSFVHCVEGLACAVQSIFRNPILYSSMWATYSPLSLHFHTRYPIFGRAGAVRDKLRTRKCLKYSSR